MNGSSNLYLRNNLMSAKEIKVGACGTVHPSIEHFDKMNEMKQNGSSALDFTIGKGGKEPNGIVVNGETNQNRIISDGKYGPKSSLVNDRLSENEPIGNKYSQNGSIMNPHPTPKTLIVNGDHAQIGSIVNGYHAQTGAIANGNHAQTGAIVNEEYAHSGTIVNGEHAPTGAIANGNHAQTGTIVNREYAQTGSIVNGEHAPIGAIENGEYAQTGSIENGENAFEKRPQTSVVITEKLTAAVLKDLFEDKICVLHIPNYVPQLVCDKLDRFLRDRGSDQYTHEIRKDGRADLLYFGVNRYGFPLNSTYNDSTGKSMERYFSEALPTMQSIRNAAAPYLSPIDKLRVELDETWSRKVNVATLNGQKTFCGIGRIMPASLSELSADQPHFDAVPTTYFPDIHKQFAANIYLNVPEEGGELEIWDVPPVDVENVENFTIPENWRSQLPLSIKVKPGAGDLLLLNTRRPHAITKFVGDKPRTSIQSFIGLTKESDVFLWV